MNGDLIIVEASRGPGAVPVTVRYERVKVTGTVGAESLMVLLELTVAQANWLAEKLHLAAAFAVDSETAKSWSSDTPELDNMAATWQRARAADAELEARNAKP